MGYISTQEFYNKTINKEIDIDKKYGAQCWDLFSYFTKQVCNKTFSCSQTGYVKDLWNYRRNNKILNYFNEENINNIKEGDWVIWGNCKIAPYSHIAMFYNNKFLGQNQNNISKTTLINITKTGIIGVLRPKIYMTKPKYKVGDKVNFNELYTSSTSINSVKSKYNSGIITKILENKPNPYLINKNMGWLNDNKILNNEIKTITVKKGTWNIRNGPGLNYKVIKIVKENTKLNAYSLNNNWYKLDSGYISKNAII